MKWNKLLEHQMLEYLQQDIISQKIWSPFFNAVSHTYDTFERNIGLAEKACEVMEQKFTEVNNQWERERAIKVCFADRLQGAVLAYIKTLNADNADYLILEDLSVRLLYDPEEFFNWLRKVVDARKSLLSANTDDVEKNDLLVAREANYRNIIANMNLGLTEVDNNEIIHYVNQSFCDMSGYTQEELVGQSTDILFSSETDTALLASKNELRRKGISDAYELVVKSKSGDMKCWLISGTPYYNDLGVLLGSIGIHLDITDQKIFEYKLNEARTKAEESAKAKESFFANMSHEIRTPLNAILGMSRQLEKTNLNDQQRFFLHTINTATSHLMLVINDILDISKIETGKFTLYYTGFRLEEVFRNSIKVMRPRADEKGLGLNLNMATDIAPIIIGDPQRLNQVLLNLINNGIKFTEKGAVTVSCMLLENKPDLQTIHITIKDTGCGMEENELPKLFEKYKQGNNTYRKFGGTGLGLVISKQLVEMMKGSIAVQSVKGIGTEVALTIPFNKGNEADLPDTQKELYNTGLLKNKNVLLVEDNEMNRLVVDTILKGYGVLMTEVTNGEEAIRALQRQSFDVVLMDIQMPVMNGLEAIEIIRKQLKSDIPVVALTANAIKGESERCLEAGMNGFISKPFEEKDLLNTIIQCLPKPFIQMENNMKTNREVPCNPPLFNLTGIEKIGNGDKIFVKKMVSLFLDLVPQTVLEIRSAFYNGNLPSVRALAHKIKPTIEAMDIHSLREVMKELEFLPDNANTSEKAALNIATLENVIGTVKRQLEEM